MADFLQLLFGIAASAIVASVPVWKRGRTERREKELHDLEDAAWRGKGLAELVDAEVMQAAVSLRGKGSELTALRDGLASDSEFVSSLGLSCTLFASDPEEAQKSADRARNLAERHAVKAGLSWEEVEPFYSALCEKTLRFIRTRYGGYLTALDTAALRGRIEDVASDLSWIRERLVQNTRCYLRYEEWPLVMKGGGAVLATEEDLREKYYEKRRMREMDGATGLKDADKVFEDFSASGDSALLVLAGPGEGKTQLMIHWCDLVEKKDGCAGRFLNTAALDLSAPSAFPECDCLVLFVDEAGRCEGNVTFAGIVQALTHTGALSAPAPRRIKIVGSEWTHYRSAVEAGMQGIRSFQLMRAGAGAENSPEISEFFVKRFGKTASDNLQTLRRVSGGNPQIACKAVEMIETGENLSVLSRQDFMRKVVDDWCRVVRGEVGENVRNIMNCIAVLGLFDVEAMGEAVAKRLGMTMLPLREVLNQMNRVCAGDLLVKDSEKAVYSIRPDVWRLFWLKDTFFGDADRGILKEYVRNLLPAAPLGVVSGLIGVGEDADFHEAVLVIVQESVLPPLYAEVKGTVMLHAWTVLYSAFASSELSNETIDREALGAARDAALREGDGDGVLDAGTCFLQRRMFEESLSWFESGAAHVSTRHANRLQNNWGIALSEYALFLERLGRAEDAAKAFENSFAKYEKALEMNEGLHEAATNWGTALSDHALFLEKQGRSEEAAKAFEASFAKYKKALKIKPDFHEAAYNWGGALKDYALFLDRHRRPEDAAAAFEGSCSKYKTALAIRKDYHEAAYNWGNALKDYALFLDRQGRAAKEADDDDKARDCFEKAAKAFKDSSAKYKKALKINEDYHEAANNWGNALSLYALTLDSLGRAAKEAHNDDKACDCFEKAAKAFEASFAKYKKALKIKPDFHEAAYNWGGALYHCAVRTEGEARLKRLLKVSRKFATAVAICACKGDLTATAKAMQGGITASQESPAGRSIIIAVHILIHLLVGVGQEELSQAIGELQSLDEREPLADWCIEVVRSGKVEGAPPEGDDLLRAWVSLLAKICCEVMAHRGKADDGSSSD